jgi:hypothetical protein
MILSFARGALGARGQAAVGHITRMRDFNACPGSLEGEITTLVRRHIANDAK